MNFDHWIVPILLVVFVLGLGIFMFFFNNKKQQNNHKTDQSTFFKLKLQASERLILLLERIRFRAIIRRIPIENMQVLELEQALVKEIKQEFEHNITQQLYLDETSWAMVNHAIETHIALVQGAGKSIVHNAPAQELAQLLMTEDINNVANTAANMAIEHIKKSL